MLQNIVTYKITISIAGLFLDFFVLSLHRALYAIIFHIFNKECPAFVDIWHECFADPVGPCVLQEPPQVDGLLVVWRLDRLEAHEAVVFQHALVAHAEFHMHARGALETQGTQARGQQALRHCAVLHAVRQHVQAQHRREWAQHTLRNLSHIAMETLHQLL